MYRNALVTTDGSEVSRAAFAHVKHVVDPAGKVTVVEVIDDAAHVMARTTPAGFEFGGGAAFSSNLIEEIINAQREAAEGHLEQARALLQAEGVQHVDVIIRDGMPGDAIVTLARELGCDVVLMATHGRSGLRRTILGSVADHVLRNLDDTPIILIHPSA